MLAVRPATRADLPACARVYASARSYMAATGNPDQWGDSWPSAALVEADLAAGRLLVVEGDGAVCGCLALCPGDEPTYAAIDGAWTDDGPYLTLHRVASDGTHPGVLAAAVAWARGRNPHLRIDTHRDNGPMRAAVARLGFVFCGTVVVEDGTERLAFELAGPRG